MSAALVIHSGSTPGEIILHSTDAVLPGVVVLPASTSAHRFVVEPVSGGQFLLQRVLIHPWPQPPSREGLFTFETADKARAALHCLEGALMVVDEPVVPTSPPRWYAVAALTLLSAGIGALLTLL